MKFPDFRPGGWVRPSAVAGWARMRRHPGYEDDVWVPTHPLVIKTRPCPSCGGVTTSVVGYRCALCHFAGWWEA